MRRLLLCCLVFEPYSYDKFFVMYEYILIKYNTGAIALDLFFTVNETGSLF
jgi:hypothetical protein